jgi:hypothetical protein
VVSIGLLAACAFAGDRELQTGRVRGVVFTADANGFHSVVPGAKVFLIGPATRAAAPGMIATQTVFVAAGTVSEALFEMKVEAVAQSTTVTASADAAGAQEAAGTNTVGESAVRHMPNTNERFESLLPLIPGVVRGPDGLINMKGVRSSQNGSLVNNAGVTDPATGGMMLLMAKVIEFYARDLFPRKVKWVPPDQRGKVIEFPKDKP